MPSLKGEIPERNRSYNVSKSSRLLVNKAVQRGFESSSAISQTLSKACSLAVRLLRRTKLSHDPDSGTEVNHFVYDGGLRKGVFVRLKQFQTNVVKNKK